MTEAYDQSKPSSRVPGKRLYRMAAAMPFMLPIYRTLRNWLSPHHRALVGVAKDQLLQPSPFTGIDRYPIFFAFVQSQLAHIANPRILSFGCSTGEEVFSLRRYFPTAEIVGIDINPHSIARAEQQLACLGGDQTIQFCCAGSVDAVADDSFDAVFCMAVLRNGDLLKHRPENCAAILDFAKVEKLVSDLLQCLKPEGYFAIWNSQFRFSDMSAAASCDVVFRHRPRKTGGDPLYGPDNLRLPNSEYDEAIFRKRRF